MNLACSACKGACCETLVLALPADLEVRVWLEMRGRRIGNDVRIPAKCQMLDHGACSIHETRPEPCRVFDVGGPQCISAIRAQRPKNAAQLIKLARQHQET